MIQNMIIYGAHFYQHMQAVFKISASILSSLKDSLPSTSWWRGSSLQPSAQTALPRGCPCRRTASPSASADPWRSADNPYVCSCRWGAEPRVTHAARNSLSLSGWWGVCRPGATPVVEGDPSGRFLLAEEGWRLHLGVAEAQVLVEVIQAIDKVAHVTPEYLKIKDVAECFSFI